MPVINSLDVPEMFDSYRTVNKSPFVRHERPISGNNLTKRQEYCPFGSHRVGLWHSNGWLQIVSGMWSKVGRHDEGFTLCMPGLNRISIHSRPVSLYFSRRSISKRHSIFDRNTLRLIPAKSFILSTELNAAFLIQ